MKVTSSTPRTNVTTDPIGHRSPQSGPASTGAGSASAVALSPTARALSALSDGANDIDMALVNRIRDDIAHGRLKIDTSRIADALIADIQSPKK